MPHSLVKKIDVLVRNDEEGYFARNHRGVVGTGCRARIVVRDRL